MELDKEAVLKAAVKIEAVISAGLAMEADWVLVVGKSVVVEVVAEGMQMVEEEVVVMTEGVEVAVVVERMEVEVGVVKKVGVGVEEENQEAMVENLLAEGENLKKYLMQVLLPYLKTDVEHLFQKNHVHPTTYHPLDGQKHLPFQVLHPHPLRSDGACHPE